VGALGLLMLYLVGLDQGLLLSVFEGSVAFDQNLIHEFVHDARHAAAFPCH
jgi:cobalt transporter subunit CbtB